MIKLALSTAIFWTFDLSLFANEIIEKPVEEFIKVFDTIWKLKDTARITSMTFLGNNEVSK